MDEESELQNYSLKSVDINGYKFGLILEIKQ